MVEEEPTRVQIAVGATELRRLLRDAMVVRDSHPAFIERIVREVYMAMRRAAG